MFTDARRVLLIGAVLAALLLLPATALGATNTFTGSVDATWNTAANWSDGVPTADDDAVVPAGKAVTLAAGADGVANSVALNGSFTLDGRVLTVGAGTSSIATEVLLTGGATLALGATTTWSSGNVSFTGAGGTMQIGVGDVLNITGTGASLNFSGGLWVNAGTVNRTTSAGNVSMGTPFENDGAVNVDTGTLSFGQGDGAGSSSGTYVVASGALLAFTGGDVQLSGAGARIGGPGTARIAANTVSVAAGTTFDPATLAIAGGTLALAANATVTTLNATAGGRSGAGTLTVTGVATIGGLTLDGAAATNLTGSASIAGELLLTGGHTLNMPPTATWSSGNVSFTGAGGSVQIGSDDVLNITGTGASLNFSGGLWVNAGTVNRTTSAGNVSMGTPFENDGAVNVNTGTLSFGQGDGAGASSGTYVVASGAVLAFTGGDVQLSGAGARIGGPGTARITTDTVAVAAGTTFDPVTMNIAGGTLALAANATVTTLNATAGKRAGAGTLTVSGVATIGGLTLDGAATTNLTGSASIAGQLILTGGHTLNMPPTATWSSGNVSFSGGGGSVQVGAGDVLDITGASVGSLNFNGGLWHNAGTVNRTTSTGTVAMGTPFENEGAVNVDTGTLTMGQGLTQTAGTSTVASGATLGGTLSIQGGVLRGAGTAGGNVTNSGGTVRPGSSPGKLTIGGTYVQGAGGTLEAEIDGTDQGTTYDWLAVGGNATLDGTLAIVDGPSFDPGPADTFDVLTAAGTVSGTFATLTGASVPSGTYQAQYTAAPPGRVRLALGAVPAPVNSTAPSVASSAQVGDTLTCDPGTWSGSPSFGFQWMRDGAAIVGATSNTYTTTGADAGTDVRCQVTATNAGGSASADSNAAAVTAADPPPPPPPTTTTTTTPAMTSTTPPTAPKSSSPPAQPQTIRGAAAFTQGTAGDLYLACSRLDLTLVDVLPAGRRRVAVTGAADLRLAGQTAQILLDGKRVGTTRIATDGSFAARVPAPSARRAVRARYQARVGATRSQRLALRRRMVATTLTRSGAFLVLRGRITRPFSRRVPIEVERFLSCRRRETVKIARVVPAASGAFTVRIPVPAGVAGAMYRARTRVPSRPGGPLVQRTFTLPRAIDLG